MSTAESSGSLLRKDIVLSVTVSINFDLVIVAVFLIAQVLMKEKSQMLMLVWSAPSAAFAVTGYWLGIALTSWLLVRTVSVLGGTCLLPAENTEVDVMDLAELCFLTLLPRKAAELAMQTAMQLPLSLNEPGCCSASRLFTVTGPSL